MLVRAKGNCFDCFGLGKCRWSYSEAAFRGAGDVLEEDVARDEEDGPKPDESSGGRMDSNSSSASVFDGCNLSAARKSDSSSAHCQGNPINTYPAQLHPAYPTCDALSSVYNSLLCFDAVPGLSYMPLQLQASYGLSENKAPVRRTMTYLLSFRWAAARLSW